MLSTLLLLPLLSPAHAKSTEATFLVGGGADVGAGASLPPGGAVTGQVGVPQLEGDLGVRSGSFAARVDLDLGVWYGSTAVVTLRPEQAWVRVGGPSLSLSAGAFVNPWRRESVDPWDRALTSTSMLARHGLSASVAGARLGGGSSTGGLEAFAGLDLGEGADLLAPTSSWAPGSPWLVGARGHLGSKALEVGLGGFYRPSGRSGGLEVDARGDAQVVSVEGEVLFGLGAPSGVTVAVEALPHLFVEPTARVDWYGGTPGGALGVAFRPAPFVRLAVEANYEDATPGVWVAADVFTPSTSRRSGDGGDPLRTR